MRASFIDLAKRGSEGATIPHTMITLLIVLLVLVILALLLVATLLFMRQRRRAHKRDLLPRYNEKHLSTSSTSSTMSSHHRRVMVRPSESLYVYHEKQALAQEAGPPSPTSPIPEIHITFPEEVDDAGKRQSGRVVIVRVGDSSVGLEPVAAADEKLPAYGEGERFQSLDLDRIGGLVEKPHNEPRPAWK